MHLPQTETATDPELAQWLSGLDFGRGRPLGQSNQGEVRQFSFHGRRFAIKRPKGRGVLRWLRVQTLKREFRAYQRLDGLGGFARCHGLFEDRDLVLDYIDGHDFRTAELSDRAAFFAALLALIQAMHARGVAHGDLKRKDNLRVDQHGQPVIIDLGTAVVAKDSDGWLKRTLFEFSRQTDLNAWVKLKYGGYEQIPPEDQPYLRRSRLERWLGALRPGGRGRNSR